MMARALTELSATAAADAIRSGELSSVDLVRACLERIAEREPTLHAWRHLDPDAALEQARARDADAPRGPLHGVPVGVKDVIDTQDQPTSYGSPIYDGHRPDLDAACVSRLRAAGAVILGKTVSTEFALFHPGPTTNPHDASRTPGGSSSGSAAAVADGMVPLALGTQTAASVVRPASFCGVFGLKPTFGTIPTTGVKAISPSLDTVGVFARTADDLVVALAAMAERPVVEGSSPRLAWVRTHEWEQADPDTRTALATVASELELPEVTLPDDFRGLVDSQTTIMLAEVAQNLAREYDEHRDDLSDLLRALIAEGAMITDEALRVARDHASRCRAKLSEVFADHDVVLTPSAIGEAPVGIEATGDPLFGRIWTLLGTPSVAVPGLRGPTGLPLGVQVVAAPGEDAAAIAAARWLARHL
jgi:Asp-tRNA(Asn)/Glu-tRNA(Gln) amidotransferase A subunit family amidase